MGNGNITGKTWTIYQGQAPRGDDVPAFGSTMVFSQQGNRITVQCSPGVNRPGSKADWNTLELQPGGGPNGYTGSVQIDGAASPLTLTYIAGGGRNPGKSAIECVFRDTSGSLSSAVVTSGDDDGNWRGDD